MRASFLFVDTKRPAIESIYKLQTEIVFHFVAWLNPNDDRTWQISGFTVLHVFYKGYTGLLLFVPLLNGEYKNKLTRDPTELYVFNFTNQVAENWDDSSSTSIITNTSTGPSVRESKDSSCGTATCWNYKVKPSCVSPSHPAGDSPTSTQQSTPFHSSPTRHTASPCAFEDERHDTERYVLCNSMALRQNVVL